MTLNVFEWVFSTYRKSLMSKRFSARPNSIIVTTARRHVQHIVVKPVRNIYACPGVTATADGWPSIFIYQPRGLSGVNHGHGAGIQARHIEPLAVRGRNRVQGVSAEGELFNELIV